MTDLMASSLTPEERNSELTYKLIGVRLMAQVTTSSAHRERVFLEERLNTVKQELETAERDFSQFSSKNATLDVGVQGRAMVEGAAVLQGNLIAAESELEGLRQVYTDNNVRVRSIQARIAKLKRQLEKLGGKAGTTLNEAEFESSSYPSIRQLPLLGVPFADKYRRWKIHEVVFEVLTKQCELAKVQEAKEIPTVKVLDTPEIPERKSFPQLLIMFLCTLLAGTGAMVFTLG